MDDREAWIRGWRMFTALILTLGIIIGLALGKTVFG
jgi:hypothetical protein